MAELLDQQQDLINEFAAKADDPETEEVEEDDGEEGESEESAEAEDESAEGAESEEDEGDDEEDDDNDDYITTAEDEPVKPPEQPASPAPQDDASKFILAGLTKIPVNIIVAGADGKDVVQSVEVYGYGDLPRNFKGYASPLEGELFRGAVTAQELKARELKAKFDGQQAQKATDEYVTRENAAIAEDLKELRADAVFPKFKGNPGTKEFDSSDGAKEFDRVLKFMNEENQKYADAASRGKAYRHIGFKQAFYMLNGDVKGREKSEGDARRKVAGRVVSKKGTQATLRTKSPKPVTNLMDLADEFVASGGK